MSITAVSGNYAVTPPDGQSSTGQIPQYYKQLASALQSGDLSGAQSAFNSLQKLLQQDAPAHQTPHAPAESLIQKDFSALGQALSGGDLSAAQSDFSKLQNDLRSSIQSGASRISHGLQSAHRAHHRRAPESSTSSTDSTSSTTSSSSATSSSSTGTTVNLYA